jgi:hypothetical protein
MSSIRGASQEGSPQIASTPMKFGRATRLALAYGIGIYLVVASFVFAWAALSGEIGGVEHRPAETTPASVLVDIFLSPFLETILFSLLWALMGRWRVPWRWLALMLAFAAGWLAHGANVPSIATGMAFAILAHLYMRIRPAHGFRQAFAVTMGAHSVWNAMAVSTLHLIGA